MLTCKEIKEYIDRSANSMFRCEQQDSLLSVTTPFTYPDGDDIELFLENRNNTLILSDMGETLRYLDTYMLDVTSTSKRKSIINDVVKSHNLLFERGEIFAVIKTESRLLDAIINMSQAIIRISDLLYTTRSQSLAAFEEEFKSFLDEHRFNYEENFVVDTTSYQYTFEFAIIQNNRIGLVKLLNAPRKLSQRPNISRLVQAWFEISTYESNKYPLKNRITVLDDSIYPWKHDDYKLLETLSVVNFWSNKDRIVQTLRNIA